MGDRGAGGGGAANKVHYGSCAIGVYTKKYMEMASSKFQHGNISVNSLSMIKWYLSDFSNESLSPVDVKAE